MREFAKFTLRAVQSQPVQSIAGGMMTICGVSYEEWLKRIPADLPSWTQNHAVQLAILSFGVLLLAYVFWRQAQNELGAHDRPNIGAIEAYKQMVSRSRRSRELVRLRQELLNIPIRYCEPLMTEDGIIEGRLRLRLRDELHDAMRQGRVKAWGTPGDGGPEKPIEAHEWSNMHIEFSDDELNAIPWPFGSDRQISAWQRKQTPQGKIHCYLNVRFSRENLYREFPLGLWPRHVDYVPLWKDKNHDDKQRDEALFDSVTSDG